MVRLREKIEGLAELRGWSVRRIALAADVRPQTLIGALNGHDLGVSHAIRVARVLKVPVEWLFDDRQRWDDLTEKPHWMEPGIEPDQVLGARRNLRKALKTGPKRAGDSAAGKRTARSARPTTPAQPGAKRGKRRKSAGADG